MDFSSLAADVVIVVVVTVVAMGSEVDKTVADVVVPVVVVPGAGLGDGPDDVVVHVVVVTVGAGLGDGLDGVVVYVVVVTAGAGLGDGHDGVVVHVVVVTVDVTVSMISISDSSLSSMHISGLGTTRVCVSCASPTLCSSSSSMIRERRLGLLPSNLGSTPALRSSIVLHMIGPQSLLFTCIG